MFYFVIFIFIVILGKILNWNYVIVRLILVWYIVYV